MLDKAGLVGDDLYQDKNDYKSVCIFYALFLAPKIKYCLLLDEYGIFQEHETFKRFNNSERLSKRNQFFKMINGNKLSSVFPLSWGKIFSKGIVTRNKTIYRNNCKENLICDTCNNRINLVREFEVNLKELKCLPLNDYGHMLPYYKDID